MPEYQFSERHLARVHARPEQVMRAVRESTLGDLKSLVTLLRIRGAVLRAPVHDAGDLLGKRVVDSFAASGYLVESSENEVVLFGL